MVPAALRAHVLKVPECFCVPCSIILNHRHTWEIIITHILLKKVRKASLRSRTLGTDAAYWSWAGVMRSVFNSGRILSLVNQSALHGCFHTIWSDGLNSFPVVICVRAAFLGFETCSFSWWCFKPQQMLVRKSVPEVHLLQCVSPHVSRSDHRGQTQLWI